MNISNVGNRLNIGKTEFKNEVAVGNQKKI